MTDDPLLTAIGHVELIEKYQDERHDLALDFLDSPGEYRLLAEAGADGLMLVKVAEESD